MKKLILFLTLGLFLLCGCADNTNNTTGRDLTKVEKKKEIKPDKKSEPEKKVEPIKKSDNGSVMVTLDGNESFWWVLVEFDDIKGNTLIIQDHPYLDFDELKEQIKKDFKRPEDNPFILNFIQISREMFIANSTKK